MQSLPSMIKQGMNLTKQQRGEVKQESTMDGSSSSRGLTDDKKSIVEYDKRIERMSILKYIMPLF